MQGRRPGTTNTRRRLRNGPRQDHQTQEPPGRFPLDRAGRCPPQPYGPAPTYHPGEGSSERLAAFPELAQKRHETVPTLHCPARAAVPAGRTCGRGQHAATCGGHSAQAEARALSAVRAGDVKVQLAVPALPRSRRTHTPAALPPPRQLKSWSLRSRAPWNSMLRISGYWCWVSMSANRATTSAGSGLSPGFALRYTLTTVPAASMTAVPPNGSTLSVGRLSRPR